MPGIPLNLPIPSLSDTQTQVVTKVAQALTTIENDLTPQVTSSEININTSLSFNGNKATNVNSIEFANGSNSISGAIFYNGTEWFVVTPAGTVQLTNNGSVNVASVGGIGGDYISSSALVTFNNVDNRYTFLGAGAIALSDINIKAARLNSTSGAVLTLNHNSALSRTINFTTFPVTGVSLLAYDGATNSMVDGAVNTITNNHVFGGTQSFNQVVVNGALNVTQLSHTNWFIEMPLTLGTESSSNTAIVIGSGISGASSGAWGWSSVPINSCGLRRTDAITSFIVNHTKTTTATTTISLRKKSFPSSGVTAVQNFTTNTVVTNGDVVCNITSPTKIGPRETWWIEYSAPTQVDILKGIEVAFNNI